MIKKNIKFITTGQFVTFYNTCKGFSSDVRVRDLENQHLDINAKKLSELATILITWILFSSIQKGHRYMY